MKFKPALAITTLLTLTACSNSNINTVVETSPNTTVKLIAQYSTKDLQQYINDQNICKTGTNTDACSTNKQNLANQFNFNINQIGTDNPISQIDAYNVVYKSPGVDGKPRTLSGAILVPEIGMDKIKGVIVFYHPTELAKFHVPSCFLNAEGLPAYCQIKKSINGSNYVQHLGGIFTSQGYVVVMPDYIGQGIDSSIMHPYIIEAATNAKSGINMLADTKKLLKHLGLDDTASLNLYLTGYSEGGAYSLWASKLLQNSEKDILTDNNYKLRLTAPIAGAYDLSGTQVPMELAKVSTYPKADKYRAFSPNELALQKTLVMSYGLTSTAYYHFNQKYSKVFNQDFLACGNHCVIGGVSYTISELFTSINPDLTVKNIVSAIKNDAFDSINPENNLAFSTENNSINSFTADGLNKNKEFFKILKQSDIVSWKTTTPVTLIHYDYDSVVSALNSDIAYKGMLKLSDKKLVKNLSISNFDYMTSITSNDPNKVKPVDHMGTRVFQFIAALNEFNQHSD